MRVRALDIDGDWTFGKGQNDYKTGRAAVSQNIQTRLLMFLGDCFFDTTAGIDWFNLLGSKNELALNLAISAVIMNTENVINLKQLSIVLSENRLLTIQYQVDINVTNVPVTNQIQLLLTEDGLILQTEDGLNIAI